MKNKIKFLSIIVCVIFTITILQPFAVFADNTDDSIDAIVQNKVSQINNKVTDLNSLNSATVSNYAELKSAIDNNLQNIIISNDIQLEDTLQIGYNIYFHSNDNQKTILSPTGLRHIEVTSDNVLIAFDNIVLNGNCTAKKDIGGGINAPYKNFDVFGANIQLCSADSGSAINNDPKDNMGTFAIYNCSFSNNMGVDAVFTCSFESLSYNCSAENNNCEGFSLGPADEIYHSDVIVYDCLMKNNSGYDGGGLNLYWSDVYINENTIIDNNSATNGGGIYTWECNLQNYANIRNNSADKGGAVYSYKSEISNYSNVTDNSAQKGGGGIMLEESTFTLESGEISHNKADITKNNSESIGGGIYIYTSSEKNDITINGGSIKSNIAAVGAGIGYSYSANYNSNNTNTPSIIINNGTVSNNGYSLDENGKIINIANEGGGIFGCYVEMNGGIIEKNIARYGAGIKTLDFKMTDGTIQNNGYYKDENNSETLVNYWGGGVYTYGDTTITGGSISSNQAERGAGLYIVKNLTLNANAKVENNKAHDVGGGIYFYHLVSIVGTDMSKLNNNIALMDGDQYYAF